MHNRVKVGWMWTLFGVLLGLGIIFIMVGWMSVASNPLSPGSYKLFFLVYIGCFCIPGSAVFLILAIVFTVKNHSYGVVKDVIDYAKEKPTTSNSKTDELKSLHDLMKSGAITKAEFETEKKKLLG